MGEQSQQRRRATRSTGEAEPLNLPIAQKTGQKTGKTGAGSQTDEYAFDVGMADNPRTPTSVVPYLQQRTTGPQSPPPPAVPRRQRTRDLARQTRAFEKPAPPPPPKKKAQKNVHWLLPLGVGMLAMLALWLIGSTCLAWGIQRYNDVIYGNPRTFHTDAVVGHGDSPEHPSHFIAVNLNRQAIVIEFKAGDPAKSVSYVAPVYIAGEGGDLAPVTVEFKDVNDDKRTDMIIHIHLPSQDQLSVFINDGKGFRPVTSNDKIHLDGKPG
jgi:hypothetical protein